MVFDLGLELVQVSVWYLGNVMLENLSEIAEAKYRCTQVTLEMIYDEVKQVNKRLSLIEDAIEEVIVKGLPEVTISKEEKAEIKRSIEEMKKGNCVTREELKSA